jgi:uroporphyrinogen III methyltransferase/synthase
VGDTRGFVSLVGAGPGDPELLTLAGRDRLAQADVVIADYLVNPAVLVHARPEALVLQRIAGPHREELGPKLDQARVNELLVEHAQAGRHVVRLKGGDPMIFGRGAEEAQILREAEIEFEFVPGVSAAVAAPEAAGIPVTHREHTPAVCFVSGFEAYQKAGLAVAWDHLANCAGTLVLMMSVKNCRGNAQRLIDAGRDPETPAAVIRWGTRGIQRTVVGSLADIGDRIEAAKIRAPAALVVGSVVELRQRIEWFERRPLYGKRVVVTRARPQAASLIRKLASRGAEAVAFPCLAFSPPESVTAIDRAVGRLSSDRGLIVSSPNGADALFASLVRLERDARTLAGVQIAAIGTGTRDALMRGGIRPDCVPMDMRSEGLVETLRESDGLNGRWVHLRADEGRTVIKEAIVQAGGEYELVVGYRTIRPEVSPLLLRSLRAPSDDGEGYDAICFASGKAARHFLATVGEALGEAEARAGLERAKVVAIGPVTRDALTALGIRVDSIAATRDAVGLADAVQATLLED